MIRQQPRSTRTDTRFLDTTLFRSTLERLLLASAQAQRQARRSVRRTRREIHRRLRAAVDRTAAPEEATRIEAERPTTAELIRLMEAERSEEHTSELQSLMRNSYAVFCLKKKKSKYI